jgi:sialate O-acetylesterase
MSAVAYYFGREIQKALNVPVGLIHSSWGGTSIYTWCPRETLRADDRARPFLESWDKIWAEWEKSKDPKQYPNRNENFSAACNQAAGLYNGAICPFVPYGIRGVIWYQGEGNVGHGMYYRKIFGDMIAGWRKAWNHASPGGAGPGEFPFLFVQLANYMARNPNPEESGWAEIREAQAKTLRVPNTGMAVAIDIGDAKNIHPVNKQEVGRRLALAALAKAYGRNVPHTGPVLESVTPDGTRLRLKFRCAGGRLVAKASPDVKSGTAPVKGFAIAGKDGKFQWAEAKIEGDTVLVWSDKVPAPAAVRYAWANNPECNLYDKAGLPAGPFRAQVPSNAAKK